MNDVLISIPDTIYPVQTNQEIYRNTVRAILVNDKNEIYLLHIEGEDMFGKRDHYELPGGGLNPDEDPIDGLKREIEEETGYAITNVTFLCKANIEYHLLKRWDCASIYVCHTGARLEMHLEEYEKTLFQEPIWVPVSKIIDFYENHPAITVGGMIHKRDLTILKEAFRVGLLED